MNNPIYQGPSGVRSRPGPSGLAMRAIWGRGTRADLGQTNPTVSQHKELFSERVGAALTQRVVQTTFRCIMMLYNYFGPFSANNPTSANGKRTQRQKPK